MQIFPLEEKRMSMCECRECCEGEHPGCCIECAGWGANNDEAECSYCGGSGICPTCHGETTLDAASA